MEEVIPSIIISPAIKCLLDTVNREHKVTTKWDLKAGSKLISLHINGPSESIWNIKKCDCILVVM
jgi:hypothetical protein